MMKRLQKKGSSLAAMFTAVVIACLGLTQRGESAVVWLVSEVGSDLVFITDGGSLAYNPGSGAVNNDKSSRYAPNGYSVFSNSSGDGDEIVDDDGWSGADPFLGGGFEVIATSSTGDTFGMRNGNLTIPDGTRLAGSITPIATMTFADLSIAGVFGANLDDGPIVLWTDGVTGDTISIGLSAVPEPSSTALLGLGGLALMLRRRR